MLHRAVGHGSAVCSVAFLSEIEQHFVYTDSLVLCLHLCLAMFSIVYVPLLVANTDLV